jgi:hypothetical protein
VPTAFVIAGFPNPISWAADQISGFIGGAAEAGFEAIIGGLTAWVLDAVVWVVGGVFGFLIDATDPNVQAAWFLDADGPYTMTATIGATLLVGFVLAGVAQGVLAGDAAGMAKRMVLDLPLAVLGMVGLVTITQALIRLTDELSSGLMDRFSDDVTSFNDLVGTVVSLSGGTATAFVVFLLGLVTVLAGIVLVAELVVRSALIYIVVALAPLVFAAQLWPALRGTSRKLLEILVALILSKLVIAVALCVAAAAMAGSGSGGELAAIPPPEQFAEDPGGSVADAVGLLLAATAAFGVAAFSPLLLMKLLPMTEAALVAQGIRSGPTRTAQQGLSMGSYARIARGSGGAGLAARGPAPGGAAGGQLAATGGPAAAAAVGVKAAASAATTGARTMAGSAGAKDRDESARSRPNPGNRPSRRRPDAS